MSRPKKRSPRRQITQIDLSKAQRKVDKKIEAVKVEATEAAVELARLLHFYVLVNDFGFTSDDIAKLMQKTDEVTIRIADKGDPLWFNNMKDELREKGVNFVD